MAVTSTEQERYCPWQVMMSTERVELDTEIIFRDVRSYQNDLDFDESLPLPSGTLNYGLIRVNGTYRTMHPTGVALSLKLRPGRRHFRGSELGHWMVIVSHYQELGGELMLRADRASEFELDTTKPLWPQYLDVFQSEEFVSELESQALDLVQRIGRTRMEWEVDQWL